MSLDLLDVVQVEAQDSILWDSLTSYQVSYLLFGTLLEVVQVLIGYLL